VINVKQVNIIQMLHPLVKHVIQNVKLVKIMHIIVYYVLMAELILLDVKKMSQILILLIQIQTLLTLVERNKKTFKKKNHVKNIHIEISDGLLQKSKPANVKKHIIIVGEIIGVNTTV